MEVGNPERQYRKFWGDPDTFGWAIGKFGGLQAPQEGGTGNLGGIQASLEGDMGTSGGL